MARERPSPGEAHGCVHGEAFCHMMYRSEDGRQIEWLWNSRDGVTPFIIPSATGKEMQHVNWQMDRFDRDYKPKPGDRIFVDATRELALEPAKKRVEEMWEHPEYPMKGRWETKEAAVEMFIDDWTTGGSPWVVTVQGDGSYR